MKMFLTGKSQTEERQNGCDWLMHHHKKNKMPLLIYIIVILGTAYEGRL
jgi:hypothetical protein